jgi:hypothetical protein
MCFKGVFRDGGTAIKDIGAKCAQDGLGACRRASRWKRRTGKTEGFLTFWDVAPALSPSLVAVLLYFNLRQMSPVSPGSLALSLIVASLLWYKIPICNTEDVAVALV